MLNRIHQTLSLFSLDRRAVTAIEYALIAALIAVVIVGASTQLGGAVSTTFNNVSSEL
jgi:pilus assembly protein Flp/PilA